MYYTFYIIEALILMWISGKMNLFFLFLHYNQIIGYCRYLFYPSVVCIPSRSFRVRKIPRLWMYMNVLDLGKHASIVLVCLSLYQENLIL